MLLYVYCSCMMKSFSYTIRLFFDDDIVFLFMLHFITKLGQCYSYYRVVGMAGTDDATDMHGTPIISCGTSSVGQEIYPNCNNEFKPHPGKIFDSLQEGIEFYKQHAHYVGFSVRLSSKTNKNGVINWKYCVCSKEGWHKGKDHVIELELHVDLPTKMVVMVQDSQVKTK